jgi:hypothetical protein
MRRSISGCAVALSLSSLVHAQQDSGTSGPAALEASHPASSIQLDVKVDEPAWHQAGASELEQEARYPGKSTPYRRRVRDVISGNQIYFGFECTDPDPKQRAVHSKQRDGNVDGDDTVAVVLDTYGDHRTGYGSRSESRPARPRDLNSGAVDVQPVGWHSTDRTSLESITCEELMFLLCFGKLLKMERETGLEPACPAWENDRRSQIKNICVNGGYPDHRDPWSFSILR